jgi:hypothetical protein
MMVSKHIPRRKSRIAEEYARKVRMEPPKATRQEDPLIDRRPKRAITANRRVPHKGNAGKIEQVKED